MARLRDASGLGTALRTVTGADSGDVTAAAFKATASRIIYGGSVVAKARHDASNGILTGRLIYYDRDDTYLGMSGLITLSVPTTAAEVGGTPLYESALEVELALGAHQARFFVESLANSTSVDVYIGILDPYTR